jgi:DNA-binding CsgD family transcriptional regulator
VRTDDASIEVLIRRLVQRAKQADNNQLRPALAASGDADSSVLLDLEIGDVRCVLTRLIPPTSTASSRADHSGPSASMLARDTAQLSPREQEIARMIMKGYPNKLIAKVLDISIWTVGTHLRRIFAKLGVGTRAAMVARLLELERGEAVQPVRRDDRSR